MTPNERLRARLAGQPVDKIPNMNLAMGLAAKCAGASYRQYVTDYRVLVEGNLRCAEKYGFDTLSTISDPMREASAYGAVLEMPENAVPYSPQPLLADGYTTEKLRRFDPLECERTLDRIHAIEAYVQQLGHSYPIVGWVEGVLAETADLRGVSALMIDLAMQEDGLEETMEYIFECQCQFIRAQIAAGADVIGIGNAAASLVGPALYEEYCLDYDRRMVEFVHQNSALAKLHICGNITQLLPMLVQVAPDILDLDWMVDFSLAVDTFRETPTSICGNLDPVAVLLQGNPTIIEEKITDLRAAADSKAMFAAGCEVPADTPEENLTTMNRLLFQAQHLG